MATTTKQKWLIGCGGCLVILVGFFVVLGVLGKIGIDKLGETNKETAQAIFGSELPDGYVTFFGLPIDAKDGKSHMLMTMTPKQNMLVVFDGPDKGTHLTKIDLSNEAELKQVAEVFLAKAAEKSNKIQAKDTRVDDVSIATMSNGKRFPIIALTVKNNQGTYQPFSVALIPTPGNRITALMEVSTVAQSSEGNTDFSSTQQTMIFELTDLVEATNLDDVMLEFKE